MFAVGKISVKAVLENPKRNVKAIYLLEGRKNKDIHYIQKIAKGIPIEWCKRKKWTNFAVCQAMEAI